jgi:hypothetical protein
VSGGIGRLEGDHPAKHAVSPRRFAELHADHAHEKRGQGQILAGVEKLSADDGRRNEVARAKQRERRLEFARGHRGARIGAVKVALALTSERLAACPPG